MVAPARNLSTFLQACGLAHDVMTARAVTDRWAEPGALHGFTVGGIAGHVYGAIRRFEKALDEPIPEPPQVGELADFYGRNRVDAPGDLDEGVHPLIREDGEKRASYGPEAVASRFVDLVERLRGRLPAEPGDRLVTVWTVEDGATRLETYLTTRVIELVVHADDLAASVDLPPLELPPEVASEAIGAFVELARVRAGDITVIRAFTRAERAGPGTLRVL